MRVEPQNPRPRSATARRLLEAIAQATPVTAALSHLYGYTHPSQLERERDRVLGEIASAVNDHEERLTVLEVLLFNRVTISALALDVSAHLLQADHIGRSIPMTMASLCVAFPDETKANLEDAVAELKSHGYATTTATLGNPIFDLRPTEAMFLALDLAVTGRDTRADALQIAGMWLMDERTHNIHALRDQLGWEPRRLNPPLSALRRVLPPQNWGQTQDPHFVTLNVLITPDERFKLRRMLELGRVD